MRRAFGARARRTGTALGRVADVAVRRHRFVLALTVAAQVAFAAVLFLSIDHNRWLTYQGGDQIKFATTAWALGQGYIPEADTGFGWPLLLAPLTWLTGASSVQLIPLAQAVTVLVLGPVATLAVYDIGARLAGQSGRPSVLAPLDRGSLCSDPALRGAIPRALDRAVPAPGRRADAVGRLSVDGLRARGGGARRAGVRLPWAPGGRAGRSRCRVRDRRQAVERALPRRAARGLCPARLWRHGLAFGVALVPALVALSLWKLRGLGYLPIFGLQEVHVASGPGGLPLGDSYLDRFPFDLRAWKDNMSFLREYMWSARLAQWIPVAGAIAIARRSLPAAGLLGLWFVGYVVVKGSTDLANIENGSFWRHVMPALPALVLFVAALPLLVPTLDRRLGPRFAPVSARRIGWRPVGVALAATLGAVVFFAVVTRQPGFDRVVAESGLMVPVDGGTATLTVRKTPDGNVLEWTDATTRARTFYKVYRAEGQDVQCGARCVLASGTLAVTSDRRFVDTSPVEGAVYRIGVAANWENDPGQGDVFLVSPPVQP